MTTISADGGTKIYFRYDNSNHQYSTNNSSWTTITSFPVTISNSSPGAGVLIVEFSTDITFNNVSNYFICGSDNIQFGSSSLKTDGTRPVITINGVTSYPGLVRNGISAVNGKTNIYVYNVVVNSINSVLSVGTGWIGQSYFGKGSINNHIVNCSSDGSIIQFGGGIVGNYTASNSGNVNIVGCSSSGDIANKAGGIVGSSSANTSGTFTCDSCWSTGIIGDSAGGIIGYQCEYGIITNCYSTGEIAGYGSGGIAGYYVGSYNASPLLITNCYSTGAINCRTGADITFPAGGIIGHFSANVTITNCYSLGNMARAIVGGIAGSAQKNRSLIITNCYIVGTAPSGQAGNILGTFTPTTTGPATITDCYTEATIAGGGGSWNSTNANTVLLGTPSPVIGTTWVATTVDQAYELLSMGYSPYTIVNIDTSSSPSLIRSFVFSVVAPSSSASAFISGKNYTILQISGGDSSSYDLFTIDNSSGAITTTTSIINGVYTFYVRNEGSYHFTTYVLTVTGGSSGNGGGGNIASIIPSCCERPVFRRRILDNSTFIDLVAGKTLLGSVRRGNISYVQLMTMKKAQAARS